jgi:hypothetical protein
MRGDSRERLAAIVSLSNSTSAALSASVKSRVGIGDMGGVTTVMPDSPSPEVILKWAESGKMPRLCATMLCPQSCPSSITRLTYPATHFPQLAAAAGLREAQVTHRLRHGIGAAHGIGHNKGRGDRAAASLTQLSIVFSPVPSRRRGI